MLFPFICEFLIIIYVSTRGRTTSCGCHLGRPRSKCTVTAIDILWTTRHRRACRSCRCKPHTFGEWTTGTGARGECKEQPRCTARFGLKIQQPDAFHTPCLLNLRTDHPSVSRMAGVIRWICGKCDALAPGGRRAPGFAGPERIDARRLDGERVAAVHAVRFAATSKADAGERACVSGNARGRRTSTSAQRPTRMIILAHTVC